MINKKMLILSAIMLLLSHNVIAWESCDSENENSTCAWTIEDGVLIIKGTGENGVGTMPSYKFGFQVGGAWDAENNVYSTDAPWFSHKNEIHAVKVMEGIENIGGKAFMALDLVTAELPSTLKSIEERGLWRTGLTQIDIPNGVTTIGDRAFEQNPLLSVVIPDSVEKIETRAFSQSWIFDAGYLSKDLKAQSIFIGDNVEEIDYLAFDGVTAYIYCQEGEGHGGKSCAELVNDTGIKNEKLKIYKIENGKIKVGSKVYDSFDDLPQYTLKRIYTIEEANKIAGEKNRVSITYR